MERWSGASRRAGRRTTTRGATFRQPCRSRPQCRKTRPPCQQALAQRIRPGRGQCDPEVVHGAVVRPQVNASQRRAKQIQGHRFYVASLPAGRSAASAPTNSSAAAAQSTRCVTRAAAAKLQRPAESRQHDQQWSFYDILLNFSKHHPNDRFLNKYHGSGVPLKITQPQSATTLTR